MASLQQRNGSYRVIFRHHGKQHFVPIGKVSAEEAGAKAAQVEYLLLRLDQRLIELPPGVDIAEFVRFSGEVRHSSKRSRTTGHRNGKGRPTTHKGRLATVRLRVSAPGVGPLTVNECRDHLRRTLSGTRWSVVKGLHVLRHSMISCLAAAGIDQRIIDDIVGHTSEEMRKRYRHLTPALKTQAVAAVFG